MKIEVRMAFGPGENRTVTAVVDVDPRTKLRDAEPLLHQAIINALYERARPGDVVADALQRKEAKPRRRKIEHVLVTPIEDAPSGLDEFGNPAWAGDYGLQPGEVTADQVDET